MDAGLTYWICHDEQVRRFDGDIQELAARAADMSGSDFVWVETVAPTAAQIDHLTPLVTLHPLAVEDALLTHDRPKYEQYGRLRTVVVKTLWYVEQTAAVETGDVTVITDGHIMVTVRHGSQDPFDAVRTRLRDHPGPLKHGTWGAIYAIVDTLVDEYVVSSDAVTKDVRRLERKVFSGDRVDAVTEIYTLTREVLEFRDAITPMQGVAEDILAGRPGDRTLSVPYFRDLAHHITRVSTAVSASEDLLGFILSAHLAQISMWQNEDMRRISAYAAVIAVPTLVAGVYGMNFTHMPELQWILGYPSALVLMLGVCGLLVHSFRRNGWL